MKTASPFKFISPPNSLVTVCFDGKEYQLPECENLAAALLAAGVQSIRQTPASGAPRAPFCMMGACFECLVVIDGATRQSCTTEVREELVAEKTKLVGGLDDGGS